MSVKPALVMLLAGCISRAFCAIITSFEGAIPPGWVFDGEWTTDTYQGVPYLCSNIITANAGVSGLARLTNTVSVDNLPSCDNVVAKVEILNLTPADSSLIDKVQVVVSTNNWEDVIAI